MIQRTIVQMKFCHNISQGPAFLNRNAFDSINKMAQVKHWPTESIQNSVPHQLKCCFHAGIHALQGHLSGFVNGTNDLEKQ